MQEMPRVSVVIPTRNSASTIARCVSAARTQSYPNVEVIVVDNSSSDGTPDLAHEMGAIVWEQGPERSAQRNFGASKAGGAFLLFADADMYLSPGVIDEAVYLCMSKEADAVIVPEVSVGEGFWARCRWLERSCYQGEDLVEAVRFVHKSLFDKIGGYDITMTGTEDWDFHNRVVATGARVMRTQSVVSHDEGLLTLFRTAAKKGYYARSFDLYRKRYPERSHKQFGIARVSLMIRHWRKLVVHPILAAGVVAMKVMEMYYARSGRGSY